MIPASPLPDISSPHPLPLLPLNNLVEAVLIPAPIPDPNQIQVLPTPAIEEPLAPAIEVMPAPALPAIQEPLDQVLAEPPAIAEPPAVPVLPKQPVLRPAPVVQPEGHQEEPRHSLCLKMKELSGGASKSHKGGTSNSSSGNAILQHFPYVNLSDLEIISLFEVRDLSLGTSSEEKLRVVAHLKSLSRTRFSSACSDLISTRPPIPPVDISHNILAIPPKSPSVIND